MTKPKKLEYVGYAWRYWHSIPKWVKNLDGVTCANPPFVSRGPSDKNQTKIKITIEEVDEGKNER